MHAARWQQGGSRAPRSLRQPIADNGKNRRMKDEVLAASPKGASMRGLSTKR